jgi:hypothetical protein
MEEIFKSYIDKLINIMIFKIARDICHGCAHRMKDAHGTSPSRGIHDLDAVRLAIMSNDQLNHHFNFS